jgi:pimeloyl-ACP methyl ester carboxylesterase/DNA-binding winged helix-turn-helix (wHTH) protein
LFLLYLKSSAGDLPFFYSSSRYNPLKGAAHRGPMHLGLLAVGRRFMVFRFESFQLDVAERRLLRSGELVPLRAKVFDTLCILVENHGRLVRKDELMRRLWPDSNVEENNLDHNISKLRRALQEGASGRKFIETVPRQGYRFIAEVQPISAGPTLLRAVEASLEPAALPEQEIQFFTTGDGVRLAYTIGGSGPPLVRAVDWLNHLDFEWKNPFRRQWFSKIMCHNTFLRYDQRGSGLSDWNVNDFSFERSLADFEELISHVGWDKFALLGSCQGGAIATAYAAHHPERVTKLILVGAFARGWPPPESMITEQFHAMLTLIRHGWGRDNPAFRQLWTTLFRPDAGPAETEWMNEFQRITSSPENAALMMAEFPKIDVTDVLPKVGCPTLVIHSRDEAVVPAQEGRLIASRIRGARFVELASRSHEVVPSEPAWQNFVDEVSKFLGWADQINEGHQRKVAS